MITTNQLPSLEEQARELERASQPGERHHTLEPLAGGWEIDLVGVDASGGESELARGRATIGWVLDGRYMRWETTLAIGGKTQATIGYLGYDLRARQYEFLNMSTLATVIPVASGSGDLARAGIRFTLDVIDPASGVRLRSTSVLHSIDRDHFVLDQFGQDAQGIDRVVRRQHYRRASPSAATQ